MRPRFHKGRKLSQPAGGATGSLHRGTLAIAARWGADSLRPMRSLFLLLAATLLLSGCATKPSASVYSGDGPNIHYVETERAGGEVRRTTYH